MTVGPLVCAAGTLLLSGVGRRHVVLDRRLPGHSRCSPSVSSTLVSPLTVAVLAAVPTTTRASRAGSTTRSHAPGRLLAVAALPALVGLEGAEYRDPVALTAGYHQALLIGAAMLFVGGVVSWFGLHEAGRLSETGRPPSRRDITHD